MIRKSERLKEIAMEKNNNKPKLRFLGFTDPWKQRKLGEICEEFQSGKNIKAKDIKENGTYPVYGGNGLRGYSDTYNHDGIYALIGRQGALCGNMNISYGKAYFTEHAIAVRANKSSETTFLFYLLGKMNLGQYSGQSAQPGLAVNKLLELSAFVPNYDEQKQISGFYVALDNLITLHQRKLNHLQDKKKGLLQKIFPKNDQNFPELRFLGFTDPWEQRKLGDIFEEYSEKNHEELPPLTIIQGSGTIRRDESDRNLQFDINSLSNYKMVNKDDFIVHLRSFEGGLEKANSAGIISPAYHTLHGEETDCRFYYAYFRSHNFINMQLKPHVYGVRDGRSIDIAGMKTINIPFTSFDEQKQIGDLIEKIDNLITLHQRKLNHLQQQKKALLQQMFV